jgi:hypothetical protein
VSIRLIFYQAMIILEERELQKVLKNLFEIEYIEEEYLKDSMLLRIGVRNGDEIQLCYYLCMYKYSVFTLNIV